jgi:hypothetical protein
MTAEASKRAPLSPREGWLSNGRKVLQFKPVHYDRWSQRLEVVSGKLLPEDPIPLLKSRRELRREEALNLWTAMRKQGWAA